MSAEPVAPVVGSEVERWAAVALRLRAVGLPVEAVEHFCAVCEQHEIGSAALAVLEVHKGRPYGAVRGAAVAGPGPCDSRTYLAGKGTR